MRTGTRAALRGVMTCDLAAAWWRVGVAVGRFQVPITALVWPVLVATDRGAYRLDRPGPRAGTRLPGPVVIAAAAAFTVLPGHLAQVTSPVTAAGFFGFAVLQGLIVWRSGLVVPAIGLHVVFDLATVGHVWAGAPLAARNLTVAAGVIAVPAATYAPLVRPRPRRLAIP